MKMSKYSLIKGHILSWNDPHHGSHAELLLAVDGRPVAAVVDIASPSPGSELVYWLDHRYVGPAQLMAQLSQLQLGIFACPKDQVPGLDLLGGGLIDLNNSVLVPHNETGQSDNLLHDLTRTVSDAITTNAIVYVFGFLGDGVIHDVHMNQGGCGFFRQENGTFQDGGILLEFPDKHWEAFFIAFASQSSTTDEFGQPIGQLLRDYHKAANSPNSGFDDRRGATKGGPKKNKATNLSDLAVYAKEPTAIFDRVGVCQALFEDCQQDRVLSGGGIMDKMSAEFNWWSLAIGARKPGRSSLDYRVRTRNDVRGVIISLLDSLSISLQNCIKLVQAAQADVDKIQIVVSASKCTDVNCYKPPDEDSKLGEQFYYMRSSLDFLIRISAAIRKSGSKFRYQQVDRLMHESAAELEEFRNYLLHLVLIGPTKMGLLNRILYRHTATGELIWKKLRISLEAYFKDSQRLTPVQDRVIQANLIRRNRFSIYFAEYCRKTEGRESTQARVVKLPEVSAAAKPAKSRRDSQPSLTSSQNQCPEHPIQTQSQPQQPSGGGSSAQSSRIATTLTPSFVMPNGPDRQESKSVATKISQGALKQDYPRCPALEGETFWCPYCAQPLDSTYSDPKTNKKWRGHIAEDLSPYVCVYADCKKPVAEVMYVSTDDWTQHLKDAHSTVRWICDSCWLGSGNPSQFEYENERDWVTHTTITHEGSFKEKDLPALAEASRRKVLPPVACPLCFERTVFLQPEMDNHIAEHLHSFALQALLWESIGHDGDTNMHIGPVPDEDVTPSPASSARGFEPKEWINRLLPTASRLNF